MNAWLLTGSLLIAGAAVAHSLVGEKMVLRRLFRRGAAEGEAAGRRDTDDAMTRQAVRLAWHSLSVALAGFAAVLALAGLDRSATGAMWSEVIVLLAAVFSALALLSLVMARGRHIGWMWYAAAAAMTWLGA